MRLTQTRTDDDAVLSLPRSFCEAWVKQDGHELAKIMAEDVDFVTVGAIGFAAGRISRNTIPDC